MFNSQIFALMFYFQNCIFVDKLLWAMIRLESKKQSFVFMNGGKT